MNKILIDEEAWAALNNWVTEHAGAVKCAWNRAYFRDMKIRFTKTQTVASAEKKVNGWVIRVKMQGETRLKILIDDPKDFSHDFRITFTLIRPERFPQELRVLGEMEKQVQFVSAAVIYINGYLIYGNAYEDRPVVLNGKNAGSKKVIIFRLFEGTVYAVSTSSHRSPSGVFGVRGHFRRYKNGHVIWIDEYMKGLGDANKQKEPQ